MNKLFARLMILAVLAVPFIAGCEMLQDKQVDQGKVDRIQNEVETSNGDTYAH